MRTYLAIDLKSFYASVECAERGLDPLDTHLVVADASRTNKTICLAVSPSLKALGIPGRPRLFEVVEQLNIENARRKQRAPGRRLEGTSFLASQLALHPELALDYIVAPPRMALYMAYSARVYQVYLRYVAPEDIHVYSIDEVFMDVTAYLPASGLTARQLAMKMILDVLHTTGITATAGIAPNLYLCKVAMDIVAKHLPPDSNGVRIAELDERRYREVLWSHRPLTDFWRVGKGTARRLERYGITTMGDIARCSLGSKNCLHNEDLLYRVLGVSAELLIDHAWGWEPCTLADIKSYQPENKCVGSGQVLQEPYPFRKARLVVGEMIEALALDLVDRGLVTDQLTLTVSYDRENLLDPSRRALYHGAVTRDAYGREIPVHAHGTTHLEQATASTRCLRDAMMALFDRIVDSGLLVRKLSMTACRVLPEQTAAQQSCPQLDLFTDYRAKELEEERLKRERQLQNAMLTIRKKHGKNAILKGMDLEEGATARERNRQIGGHRA